ncbi:MAG: hypothetical protein AB8H12_01455 [Lewinella sp.]
MQANNDPKWTDDAAFWNEAWADMDKRLNEQLSNRKVPVVWWRRYGWMLGLLLLITAVATPATITFLSHDSKAEEQESASPKAPAKVLPTVIADNDDQSTVKEIKSEEQLPAKAIIADRKSDESGETDSSKRLGVASPSTFALKQAPPIKLADRSIETATQNKIAFSPSPKEAPIATAEITIKNSSTEQLLEDIPTALSSLTSRPIRAIQFDQDYGTAQIDAVVKKSSLASRLYLNAGLSNGLRGNKIGYYAGLQYNLPISKRLSIPVGLRFRRDFHRFVELAESQTTIRFLQGNSTAAAAPDTILFAFNADNLSEVVTTGFEGRIGFEYAATHRLRVGASLSINYLQLATARLTTQSQTEFAGVQDRFLNEDADITLVSGLSLSSQFDASVTDPITSLVTNNGVATNSPSFNQWTAHAGLDVAYDLNNRLSLTLAGRRLFTQPDQSKIIGIQRGQLELGARWRLK